MLVSAGAMQGLGLLRSLAQALRLWSWGGVACDLVVVNAEAGVVPDGAAARARRAARAPRGRERGAARAGDHRLARAARRRAVGRRAEHAAAPGARAPAAPTAARCCTMCRTGSQLHEQALRAAPRHLDHGAGRSAAAADAGAPAPHGRVRRRLGRVPLRRRRARCARRGRGSTCWPTRLRRAALGSRRRLHLGRQQPPEPAHRLVERPGGRPAVANGSCCRTARRARCGAWRRRPGATTRAALPRGARPGLQRHQPPPRRPGGDGVLVRRRRRARSSRCGCASSTAATARCTCAWSASPSG